MATIAVTGVGGLLGRALVARLQRDPQDVARLIGLDVRVPDDLRDDLRRSDAASDAPSLELREVDIRDAAFAEQLDGVDVLVHLAFQMDPIRDLEQMRSVNIDGTMNVLDAARSAGVGRVIYLSSVVAYGAYPDNEVPLTEASTMRTQPGFTYAEHKHEVEQRIWPWLAAGDGPALTVLRSAMVFGPGVQNFLTRVLELPALPDLPDAPPLQFIHVDDIVGAIVHAIANDLDGAFNVAPDGWIDYATVLALSGRRTLALDHERMRALVDRAHRLGVGELEPGTVELFRHPWLLSNARLRSTGWAPTRSNEETLLETVLEHEQFVSLGRVRTTRGVLRTAGLVAGALVAAASAAALRRR